MVYRKKTVCLILPAYNEEKLIIPTIKGAPKIIDRIIVVDDGSIDKTAKVVKQLKDKRIELIQHGINKGLGSALSTGYNRAKELKFDMAVVVGADNQMPLNELPNFLDPIIDGKADYTKGNRFLNKSIREMPYQRVIGNTLLSLLEKPVTGYWGIFDNHDGYTVMSKKALNMLDFNKTWKGYGYNMDYLARLNAVHLKVKDISRTAIYLKGERQSQIRVKKYIRMALPLMAKTYVWRIKQKYLKRLFKG
jgi:glycosyltransferase involved in cell wall biosynthesis